MPEETIKPWEENIKPGVACFDLYPARLHAFAGEYFLDYLTATFPESFALTVKTYYKGVCGIPDNYKCPKHQTYTRTVKQYDDGETTCPTCEAGLQGGQIDSVCAPFNNDLELQAVPKVAGTGDWFKYADEGVYRYAQEPTADNLMDGIRAGGLAPAEGVIHISPLYRQAGWRNAEDEWISQEDYDELTEQEKEAYTNQDGSDGLSLGDEEWDGVVTISAGTGTQEGVEWRLANGNAPTAHFVKIITASANDGAVTGTGLLMVNSIVVKFSQGACGLRGGSINGQATCEDAKVGLVNDLPCTNWIVGSFPTLPPYGHVYKFLGEERRPGYTQGFQGRNAQMYLRHKDPGCNTIPAIQADLSSYDAELYSAQLFIRRTYTEGRDGTGLTVISDVSRFDMDISHGLGNVYIIEKDYPFSETVEWPPCPEAPEGGVSHMLNSIHLDFYAVIFPLEEVE